MKIFQFTQRNFIVGGFIRGQRAFNLKQSVHILISFTFVVLQFLYLFRVASTPNEYMISIFMTTVGLLVFISFISIVFKYDKLFDFIDDIEQTGNESKNIFNFHPILTVNINKCVVLLF